MPLIDLRQHFGIWDRCGNTSFWRQTDIPEHRFVLVDPVNGKMITAHDHPFVGGPALSVVVRDASELPDEDIRRTYERNYPWVKMVMSDFFVGLTYIRINLVKETPLSFFLKHYADQTQKYKETGEGHSDFTGKDELLAATKKILISLEDRSVKLRKVILRDEWDEFLESQGILEC